jgi:hypothetical protein
VINTLDKQGRSASVGAQGSIDQFFKDYDLVTALLRKPERLVRPFAWVGHLPFVQVLFRLMHPTVVVELGTHTGNSFCSFCQAIAAERIDTRCYAVDTWLGDEQAGFYGSTVYEQLSPYILDNYGDFASLVRSDFDSALEDFDVGSVDLLHIDGLHTYEAVRHDYETWKNKLSHQGVILFHDTQECTRGFGVHKLWMELKDTHLSFEFKHSHGLGVLLVGSCVSPAVGKFIDLANKFPVDIQSLFESASQLWLADDVIAYQRRFGTLTSLASAANNFDCELYFDTGLGFNEGQKLISTISVDKGFGTALFGLERFADSLLGLRFDPGHEAIALRKVQARGYHGDVGWSDIEVKCNSSVFVDKDVAFYNSDPWVEFDLNQSLITSIEISFEVQACGSDLVNGLFLSLQNASSLIEQAHELSDIILDKDTVIDQLQIQVIQGEAETLRLWEDLGAKDTVVDQLQIQVIQGEADTLRLWEDLGAKDTVIDQLHIQVIQGEAETLRLWEDLGAKDTVIDQLQIQVIQGEAETLRLWEDLGAKDTVIDQLQIQVIQGEAETLRLWEDLGAKDTVIDCLQGQVKQAVSDGQEVSFRLDTAQALIAAMHEDIGRLQSNLLYRVIRKLKIFPAFLSRINKS